MESLIENLPVILAVMLGLSEALAHIPQVKSNSIFQMVKSALKGAKQLLEKKEEK